MNWKINRTATIVTIGWILIIAKALLVPWAVEHWQMPIAAGWLVWPTIGCGLLATVLWLAHRRPIV